MQQGELKASFKEWTEQNQPEVSFPIMDDDTKKWVQHWVDHPILNITYPIPFLLWHLVENKVVQNEVIEGEYI